MKVSSTISSRIQRYSPEIFDKSPLERNQIVYIPSFLCQASMPKDLGDEPEWRRSFNNHNYTILSPSFIGLPGGAYSRLILIQINTIAKISKSREINLGSNYSEFMHWMGLIQRGGKNKEGNIKPFKEHFIRCINTTFHEVSPKGAVKKYSLNPVIHDAWMHTINDWRWESKIILSSAFFEESQKSVPTDLGALLCLSPGTLRMDVFNFLVKRLFYLKKETLISWREIEAMFSSPKTASRSFRQSFKKALLEALVFYQDANVSATNKGLVLRPSRMLIQPLK